MSYSDLDGNYAGDAYASSEPPPYPEQWSSEERVAAYWYALNRGIKPRSTAHWLTVLADARRTSGRHLSITEKATTK